ncbi:MAG: helix-turn-helix transcriptional regulator [Ruminococcus bromii]|nr:helix-turn-helix transcriptional regulator [Ruminococcus bromii]
MEKKTIGGFISALRKANGMTQKELAERLNVSDKTVSRWERDDGAPDLAVIPVIAEIFNVTCDELLRGERKSPAERIEIMEDNESSPKSEKQRQRLLKSTLSQYQNLTYIAMGVSVVGMIVALICNLAFLKAVLGFLFGAIFFAASIVCQAVFMNRAFLSVEDAGIDEVSLSDYKRKVIGLAEKSIGLTVMFIGFTFPLIMVDAYVGLGSDSLLIWGAMGAMAFMAIYAVVVYFLNGSFLNKGVYTLSDKEAVSYNHNRNLKKKCSISFVIILAITLLFHAFGGEMIWSSYNLSASYGIMFDDYDSFVEYMEQDIPADTYETNYNATVSIPVPEEQIGEPTYYDEFGNEISEEEALTRTIEDSNGNIVCTYIHRNENVSNIRYSAKDGTVLPIQVIKTGDYRAAVKLSNLITTIYCVLYPIELLVVLLIYLKKRAK